MNRFWGPVQIVFYQDVLCGWCFVAEQRLAVIQQELGDRARWITRPFPLRLSETPLTSDELAERIKDLTEAKKEPEGAPLSAELWTSGDPPRSSMAVLAALEAARMQGSAARRRMAQSLQRAGLEQGINVSRTDVLFELASACHLDLNRFSAAFNAPEIRRMVREEHRLATDRGVQGVPSVVINERWMICGLRDVDEYREHIGRCLEKVERARSTPSARTLH